MIFLVHMQGRLQRSHKLDAVGQMEKPSSLQLTAQLKTLIIVAECLQGSNSQVESGFILESGQEPSIDQSAPDSSDPGICNWLLQNG